MNKICLDRCILQTVQHCTRKPKEQGYFVPANLCPYKYHGKTYDLAKNKKAQLIVHKIFDKPGSITPEGFILDHSGLIFFSITRWVEYVLRQEQEYHENRRWCGYAETSVLFPDGKLLPVECFRVKGQRKSKKVLSKMDRMNLFKFFYGDKKKTVPCIICKKQKLSTERGNAWHAAHVDPKCNGGKLEHPNLVPICTSCNSENSSMHMFEYLFQKNKIGVIADIIRPSCDNIVAFYHQHFAATAPLVVTETIQAAETLIGLK